jgi:hypothetical protein
MEENKEQKLHATNHYLHYPDEKNLHAFMGVCLVGDDQHTLYE